MPARTRYLLLIFICMTAFRPAHAQQFTGLSLHNYSAVQQMPYNPAWVCHSDDGTELHLFSVSGLIGTNAYTLSKGWLTRTIAGEIEGPAVEDEDYVKDRLNGNKKYLWGNIDMLGPAVSFRLRPNIFAGAYTRVREVANGGNLTTDALQFIGDQQHASFGRPIQFSKAGFTMHAFTELGITFGTILKDDGYHRWRAGMTLKYLIGLAAGSVYANSVDIQLNKPDSLAHLSGDLSVKYSENISKLTDNDINNDMASWLNPGGKRSIGADFGIQYEYHPDYNPNHETPYLFSIAASVTDIGAIKYQTDTGSAVYELKLKDIATWQYRPRDYEPTGNYLGRMTLDSMLQKKDSTQSFRVSLPTAFRLNADMHLGSGFACAADLLLNLQSTRSGVYNPGYVNTFCITPRYERKQFMIGLPLRFSSHQPMTLGAVMRAGPLFIGSGSIISCAISNHLSTLDGYAGLSFKLKSKQRL